MEIIRITPSVLKEQVEAGWKLKPLADHYNLPVAQMKKALSLQNLQIRKFHAPKFVFTEIEVEDVNHNGNTSTPEVIPLDFEEEVENIPESQEGVLKPQSW